MTTTFTVNWGLAGQWTVGLIVLVLLVGAIAMNLQRRGD